MQGSGGEGGLEAASDSQGAISDTGGPGSDYGGPGGPGSDYGGPGSDFGPSTPLSNSGAQAMSPGDDEESQPNCDSSSNIF